MQTTKWAGVAALVAVAMLLNGASSAQEGAAVVHLSVKNHQFVPAEIKGPANRPITLRIKNLDAKPMEFESVSLRVEKVIAGNSEGIINLRPLQPGRYNFLDDFNQSTKGTLVIQ
jgi:hypothetical protein